MSDAEEKLKLREAHSQLRDTYIALINDKPNLFAQLICEAALGIPNENNPLCKDENTKKLEHRQGVAEYVLSIVYKTKRPELEYFYLKDWVKNNGFGIKLYSDEYLNIDVSRIMQIFLDRQSEDFNTSIMMASELVHHGIPLYKKNEANEIEVLPFTNEDYVYIAQRGKYQDITNVYIFPEWTEKYLIKKTHLDAYKIYFGDSGRYDLKAHEIDALRVSFRNHIGFGSTADIENKKSKNEINGSLEPAKDDPQYPEELDIALQAWRSVRGQSSKKLPKEQLNEWLTSNFPHISNAAKLRIATVCNWEKKGGAPTTPG